jgi:hypothetical protein
MCPAPIAREVAEHRRPQWALFDEAKVLLVREFLRREFRGCKHRDFVTFDPTTHVFIIEPERGVRRTLVIPTATFDVVDFGALLNAQLAETLTHAGEGGVTLTPDGPDVRP